MTGRGESGAGLPDWPNNPFPKIVRALEKSTPTRIGTQISNAGWSVFKLIVIDNPPASSMILTRYQEIQLTNDIIEATRLTNETRKLLRITM